MRYLKIKLIVVSQIFLVYCTSPTNKHENIESLYIKNHKVQLEETEEHSFRFTPQFITFVNGNLAVLTRAKSEIRLFNVFNGNLMSVLKASDLPYESILKKHKEQFGLNYGINDFLKRPRVRGSLKIINLHKSDNGTLHAIVSYSYPRYGKHMRDGKERDALFHEVSYAIIDLTNELKFESFTLIKQNTNSYFASISSFSDWKKISDKILAPTTVLDSLRKEQYYLVKFDLDSSGEYYENDSLSKSYISEMSKGMTKRGPVYSVSDISWSEKGETLGFANEILSYSKEDKLFTLFSLNPQVKLGEHYISEEILFYQGDGAAMLDTNSLYEFFKFDSAQQNKESQLLYNFGKRYNFSRPILNDKGICFIRKERDQACYVEFYSY